MLTCSNASYPGTGVVIPAIVSFLKSGALRLEGGDVAGISGAAAPPSRPAVAGAFLRPAERAVGPLAEMIMGFRPVAANTERSILLHLITTCSDARTLRLRLVAPPDAANLTYRARPPHPGRRCNRSAPVPPRSVIASESERCHGPFPTFIFCPFLGAIRQMAALPPRITFTASVITYVRYLP